MNNAIFERFDDISLGTVLGSAGRTISEADFLMFSGLTAGFHNPVHHNVEWIRAHTEFRDRVFPGPGILAYAIGMLSATLVWRAILIAQVGLDEVRTVAPVYPGDTITARATIVGKRVTSRPDRGIVNSEVVVLNQDEKAVMTYKYAVMVRVQGRAG